MILRRKFNGAKLYTEAWDMFLTYGRRALNKRRSRSGSAGGFYSSENAGMSSENYVRIIMAERLRDQKEGSSASV